jgi:septal ring-binding cell division protein DamX
MAETVITAATAEEQAVVVRDVIPEPEMAVSEHDDVLLQTTMSETASSEEPTTRTSADFSLTADNDQWLSTKLRESLEWLSQADGDSVSIQVLIRNKAAAKDLVYFLRNDWPLDISITYLYEVNLEDLSIYRVFYSQFNSLSKGRDQIDLLPDSVKVNSPYLQSVHRMQKALL